MQYGILSGKIDTLIALPFSFNIAIATALVPTISAAMAKKQMDVAKPRIEFSILVTILIGLPCSLCMSIFAKEILELLFPNAASGATMLSFASWTIILVVLIQTINGALQGMGKATTPVVGFAIGAIIKLTLNILLIPIRSLGVNGAILSSIVSHLVTLIICFITLKKSINIKFKISKFLVKPLIVSVLMGGVIYQTYIVIKKYFIQNIALVISLVVGSIIYVILIFLFKILSRQEIYMITYGQKMYGIMKKHK